MRRLGVLAVTVALAGCGGSPGGSTDRPQPRATVAFPPQGELEIVPTPSATASPAAVRAFQARMTRICAQERERAEGIGAPLARELRERDPDITKDELTLEVQARTSALSERLFDRLRTEARPPTQEREAYLAYLDTTEAIGARVSRGVEELLRGDASVADLRALPESFAREQASADAWFDRIGVAGCADS